MPTSMPTSTGSRHRGGHRRPPISQCTYTLGCEVRAEEEHHAHRWVAANAIEVKADSTPGWYLVAFEIVGDRFRFHCDCPAGTYRANLPMPCKHAAKFGRLLEGRRQAVMLPNEGMWQPVAPAAA